MSSRHGLQPGPGICEAGARLGNHCGGIVCRNPLFGLAAGVSLGAGGGGGAPMGYTLRGPGGRETTYKSCVLARRRRFLGAPATMGARLGNHCGRIVCRNPLFWPAAGVFFGAGGGGDAPMGYPLRGQRAAKPHINPLVWPAAGAFLKWNQHLGCG